MDKAIKLAIEGGYNVGPIEVDMVCDNKYAHYFIDPLFWSSLGKALGWKKYTWTSWKGWDDHTLTHATDEDAYEPPFENPYCQRHLTHEYHWHRFIDSLASDGDPDSFFSSLLQDHSKQG